MSMTLAEAQKSDSGCVRLIVWLVMPVMSIAAATVGLLSGAVLTLDCARVERREVEATVDAGRIVTGSIERVVQEGRVDVTVRRRILGLVPLQTLQLPDVVDVDSSSGTHGVTNRSGRTTSTYKTGAVELTTRAGTKWRSPEMSHSFGASAAEMEARIEQFITEGSADRLTLRSVPWLSNVIGVPFTLVAAMFMWMWLKRLAQLVGLRRTDPKEE